MFEECSNVMSVQLEKIKLVKKLKAQYDEKVAEINKEYTEKVKELRQRKGDVNHVDVHRVTSNIVKGQTYSAVNLVYGKVDKKTILINQDGTVCV